MSRHLYAVPDDGEPVTHVNVIEIMGMDGTAIPYPDADDWESKDNGSLVLYANGQKLAEAAAGTWSGVEIKPHRIVN